MSADPLLSLAGQSPRQTVEVPGVGPVLVRGLFAGEVDAMEDATTRAGAGGPEVTTDRALFIRYGAIREDGKHRYTDDDLPALRNLPTAVIRLLFDRIRDLSTAAPPAAG